MKHQLCPVCRRLVAVSNVRHVVFAHHDKAYNNCPMSGHVMGGDDLSVPESKMPL